MGFLVVTFIVGAYWFPRVGPLGRSMREMDGSGRELRDDGLNPLYGRVPMRRRKKSSGISFMWNIRGLYWCQVQAVIQIFCVCILELYSCFHRGAVYEILWKILGYWVLGGAVLYYVLGIYYSILLNKSQKDEAELKKNWAPFCLRPEGEKAPHIIKCQNDFMDIRRKTAEYFSRQNCLKKVQKQLGHEGSLLVYVNKKGSRIEIFMLAETAALHKSVIEELNEIYQREICGELTGTLAALPVFLTYLVCASQNSREFQNLVCSRIYQKKEKYCLPAGIIFSEKRLYIAEQRDTYGAAEYQKMKERLLDILELSGQ